MRIKLSHAHPRWAIDISEYKWFNNITASNKSSKSYGFIVLKFHCACTAQTLRTTSYDFIFIKLEFKLRLLKSFKQAHIFFYSPSRKVVWLEHRLEYGQINDIINTYYWNVRNKDFKNYVSRETLQSAYTHQIHCQLFETDRKVL